MSGRVRFTEAAETDVDEASSWYATQRPELSLAFLEAMNEVVDRIARAPLSFPVRLDDVRQANMPKRWPYSLWFVVEPDESIVIAALHQRRDPKMVLERKPRP